MKSLIAVAIGLFCLQGVAAAAANLCDCCGEQTAQSCATACAPVKPPEGQCVATVDFSSKAKINPDKNPLYDISLRNMWLGTPDGAGLESFRRLLESARRGAERDRKAALRAHARGKIDDATNAVKVKRYEDAIINYYLGMQAYRLARSNVN
jgi:hypothetical protein